jgi:hypothetical protein
MVRPTSFFRNIELLLGGASALLLGLAFSTPALAQSKEACVAAYKGGQIHRKNGELLAARDDFEVCAQDACSAVLRKDCKPWLAQVEQAIPTIIVEAKDEASLAIAAPKVFFDGEPAKHHTPDGAFELDPGAHVVRVEAPGREPVERSVKLRAGEKSTSFAVTLAPARPVAPPPGASRPIPGSTIAFGILGVAGLGAFAGFGLHGSALKSDLEACKPACAPARVDVVKRDYIIADVSLGLGVVFLGLATYTFVTRPAAAPKTTTLHVDWAPGTAKLGVSGSF